MTLKWIYIIYVLILKNAERYVESESISSFAFYVSKTLLYFAHARNEVTRS